MDGDCWCGAVTSYNNFTQFAELAIPVAIVRGFDNRKAAGSYILSAGLLFAAVGPEEVDR